MLPQLNEARAFRFDPYLPMVDMWKPAPQGACSKVERLRQRRSDILASARRVMVEDGYEAFTIRKLADVCSVTPQTLHNYFGSRGELLSTTLNEFTNLVFSCSRAVAVGPTFFLELASSYHQAAETAPEFMRQMMVGAFSTKQPLFASLQRHAAILRMSVLRDMNVRSLLQEGVDLHTFGRQICRANTGAMYEWAVGNIDTAALRREVLLGTSFLLRGVLTSAAQPEVETWLEWAGAKPTAAAEFRVRESHAAYASRPRPC